MDRKYTKRECKYRKGQWPYECGTCIHFSSTSDHECNIVSGWVYDEGLCSFWSDGNIKAGGGDSTPVIQPGSSVHTDPWGGLPFPRGSRGSKADEIADYFDHFKQSQLGR